MKYLMTIFAMAVLAGFAACSTPTNDASPTEESTMNSTPATAPIKPGETLSAKDRAACEAAGGTVGRAGLVNWEHCIMPYKDAGKVCSDNSECTGQCRNTLPAQGSGPVTGKCQANNLPFGCYGEVKNGKVTSRICVD